MIKGIHKRKSGYSLVEMLFYISIFAIFSVVIINILLVMTRSFREMTVYADLVKGSAVIERISREIKKADDVSLITPTNLRLSTRDEAGALTTIEFALSGSNISLIEGGVVKGNLNSPNVAITSFVFTQITTTEGKAVKVSLSMMSNRDSQGRVHDFYDTLVLRGNY